MGGDLGDRFPAAPGDPVPVEPRLSLPDDKERKLAKEVKLRDGGTLAPEDDEDDCDAAIGGELPIALGLLLSLQIT